MITLLVRHSEPAELSAETRFGGRPVAQADSGATWPTCRTCGGLMQFLGRVFIADADRLVLLYMCQNDPGGCEEWDANAGGNAAIVIQPSNLVAVEPPQAEQIERPLVYGAKLVAVDGSDYYEVRDSWGDSGGEPDSEVLGQWSGSPPWLQEDETPKCGCCGASMSFVALLEEGPDSEIGAMNFGGGSAYLFLCPTTKATAKLLWQC